MKANELKLGHLVHKNDKLTIITIEVLKEILEEENKDDSEKIYKPILLNDRWLKNLKFTRSEKSFGRNGLYYVNDISTFRVGKYLHDEKYFVGYSIVSAKHKLYIRFRYLHELLNAHEVFVGCNTIFNKERLNEIEDDLKKNEVEIYSEVPNEKYIYLDKSEQSKDDDWL
jgi:hypothetical protein